MVDPDRQAEKQQACDLIQISHRFMVATATILPDIILDEDGKPMTKFDQKLEIAHVGNVDADIAARMIIAILDTHPEIRTQILAIELDRGGPPHGDEDDLGDPA